MPGNPQPEATRPTSPSELFERAHNAGDPDALADLGSIYYQQGQLAKARELYEQARDSGDPAALVGLGHIYDLDNAASRHGWPRGRGGAALTRQ